MQSTTNCSLDELKRHLERKSGSTSVVLEYQRSAESRAMAKAARKVPQYALQACERPAQRNPQLRGPRFDARSELTRGTVQHDDQVNMTIAFLFACCAGDSVCKSKMSHLSKF